MATAIGDRYQVLTDKQLELLELLLPKSEGHVGRNFANNRLVGGHISRPPARPPTR
ncbi:hypothetical protein [Nocardia araoensis]|uniref:hypothetical protein n=1 Tax=Nocardia araoensis TaxID=228600 RepID=UPI001C3F369D|nr:hypothetical protein [Nocardia araoensis]